MTRLVKIALGLAAAAAASAMIGAGQPPSWDGLVNVPSKKMDAVYLLPGADFRPYTKIMIDPVQVSFQKNWIRNFNSSAPFDGRITKEDAARIIKQASEGFDKIMRDAYVAAGYPVVTEAGPDVVRLSPAVADLVISSPDLPTAYATKNWGVDAGSTVVVLEARDSMSHAILGRGIDGRRAGENEPGRRTGVSNRGQFEDLFRAWAKIAVGAMAELKERSPVAAETAAN